MRIANIIEDGQILIQAEYEVGCSNGKAYSIQGNIFLADGWDINGKVIERDFLVSFYSNWECDTVLRFKGEDFGKGKYTENTDSIAYYQTGSVYGLINISRAMVLIHRLLEMELSLTDTYMEADDNRYAKSFNILEGCQIEIIDINIDKY